MAKDKFKHNVPEGRDPGEFLTDAKLAEYYAERAAADPADTALARLAARAARAVPLPE